MERFAKSHRKKLNYLLVTHIAKTSSDSTFWLLLAQLDVDGFESLLQQWIADQPGVAETVDTLVCDGMTLLGSIAENAAGTARFIAQLSLYYNTLGMAIAQRRTPLMMAARSRLCVSCSTGWSSETC